MGACHIWYDEIRMDVRSDEHTHVYVYIRTEGDCPHFLDGWHHKAFPGVMSTLNILESWAAGEERPEMWDQAAPPSAERNAMLEESAKAADALAGELVMSKKLDNDTTSMLFSFGQKLRGMKK